jgi:ATP-dependent DNA helicase RecG
VREAVASSETYTRRVDALGPLARQAQRTWEILHEEIQRPATVNGLERRETLLYPEDAVREAVVNAIAHRDYAISGQRIEVRLFDDRMEIMSPGGLPGHITVDNMRDEHYSRNPRLVRALYYWRYIEELGQGVDIIYDAMRRDHHPAPVFQDTRRNLIVTLYNAVDQIALRYGNLLNPRQERAIRWIEAHERITNREYRELCPEVTPETLRLDLRDLVEKGILLQVGSKRGTYYIFKAVRTAATA